MRGDFLVPLDDLLGRHDYDHGLLHPILLLDLSMAMDLVIMDDDMERDMDI